MKPYTLVIGASTNPDRYSYKAIMSLLAHGHSVRAISLKKGEVQGVIFDTEKKQYVDIDTVTVYIRPDNQSSYYEYVISLKPRRVIFNPGTENKTFYNLLRDNNIQVEEACTLVLLSTNQY